MKDLQGKDKLLVRGEVRKHLAKFEGFVKLYGAAAVKECLLTGKTEVGGRTLRLTYMKNMKDRKQMIQMLSI